MNTVKDFEPWSSIFDQAIGALGGRTFTHGVIAATFDHLTARVPPIRGGTRVRLFATTLSRVLDAPT